VPHRPKFGLETEFVDVAIATLEENALWVKPVTKVRLVDREDEKFLECAIDGNAVYLITGNTRHYPKEDWIITPHEFIERIF
jgi:predicted nucleic acid-binding protein